MLLNASFTDIDHRNKEGSYFPRIHTGSCEFPYDDTPGIQPKFAVSTLGPTQPRVGALGSPAGKIHIVVHPSGGTARTHYELC